MDYRLINIDHFLKRQLLASALISPPSDLFRAEVAAKHAETHFKLLTSFADSTKLNLTKLDDEIYKHFRQVREGVDLRCASPY